MTDEDNSKTIELNRRRVLGGIVTIGGAAAAAGAGTTALFFDEAETNGNSIEAGTLKLGDISGETFNITGLIPEGSGDSTTIGSTQYTGDVSSPVLDWGLVVGGQNAPGGSGPDLTSELTLDTAVLSAGPSEDPSEVVDYTGGENTHLSDLAGSTYTDEYTLSPDDYVEFELGVSLGDVGNEYQGASIDFGFAFLARQSGATPLSTTDISAGSSGGN
ncbi:hypothetical protein [Halosimplex marinum]|uniref:hypothetical protein n=1 Tax=Halosimplex marinum TaxID=3396620 RepID=UPI003F573285